MSTVFDVEVTSTNQLRPAAAALDPLIRDYAVESERLRTLAPEVVAAARRAGLFRMAMPAALGGWEADPLTIFEAIETLSYADGSAGWSILIGNATFVLAWLEPDVALELLGGNPDQCSTGVFAPLGQGVPDGKGALVVNGRWPFNSGSPHADLFMAGVRVSDDGVMPRVLPDGRYDLRHAYLPRESVEVLDNWFGAGLRGTGSHDIVVRDARVPEEWTCSPLFEQPHHDGALFRFSFYMLISLLLSGLPSGVARRAIDEVGERVVTKRRTGPMSPTVAEDETAQVAVADADALVRSARAFFVDAIGEAWATVTRGDRCSLRQRALVNSAGQRLLRAGIAAVDAVAPYAGASSVYNDDPLQRCVRDLHTVRSHIFYSDDNLKRVGKALLGIEQPEHLL
jgi:alkylation response protein AidB-like acyl-CoA dehydrogenase